MLIESNISHTQYLYFLFLQILTFIYSGKGIYFQVPFLSETKTMASCRTNILQMPPEILENILKNLSSVKDIISCSKTCTQWKYQIKSMFRNKGMYCRKFYLCAFYMFCFALNSVPFC